MGSDDDRFADLLTARRADPRVQGAPAWAFGAGVTLGCLALLVPSAVARAWLAYASALALLVAALSYLHRGRRAWPAEPRPRPARPERERPASPRAPELPPLPVPPIADELRFPAPSLDFHPPAAASAAYAAAIVAWRARLLPVLRHHAVALPDGLGPGASALLAALAPDGDAMPAFPASDGPVPPLAELLSWRLRFIAASRADPPNRRRSDSCLVPFTRLPDPAERLTARTLGRLLVPDDERRRCFKCLRANHDGVACLFDD